MPTPLERQRCAAAATPDLGANQEGPETEMLSVRILTREACKFVAATNLPISGSRVRKLVRRFVREGRTDIDFRTWFISYADPGLQQSDWLRLASAGIRRPTPHDRPDPRWTLGVG